MKSNGKYLTRSCLNHEFNWLLLIKDAVALANDAGGAIGLVLDYDLLPSRIDKTPLPYFDTGELQMAVRHFLGE